MRSPLSSEVKRLRFKLYGTALLLFLLFAALILQFYKLQILEHSFWDKQAQRQHFFTVHEAPRRGSFYSNTSIRKNHLESPLSFVADIQKFHLFADPLSIPVGKRTQIAMEIGNLLELPEEKLNALCDSLNKRSRSRKLLSWLSDEQREKILEWWLAYARENELPRNALFFITDYQRSYPFGKLLGPVLHTVRSQKDERHQTVIPTGGLELAFDKILRGSYGERRLMRSPRHAFETGEVISSAVPGADLYLTINHVLQAIAEEELEKGVKRCRAKGGWAVMLEPKTGAILALAQYPFFYPSHYSTYFNDPESSEWTKVKAVSDAEEPGSVIKPFTIAIAMLANEELKRQGKPPIFSPDEKVDTTDGRVPGRRLPLKDLTFHHCLDAYMAIQRSSNIYVGRLVQRMIETLGNQWYRQTLQECFGFGVRTGVELPAESPGVLPKIGKKFANGKLEWSLATPFSLCMGHSMQVNTIQLARAYAVFANGGYLVKPTLIRQIVAQDAENNRTVVVDNTQGDWRQKAKQVMTPEMVAVVVKALKYVTKPGGSGWRADVAGYSEAGKSGTGKKVINGVYVDCYCSSFAGFVPANDPAFVLVVTMDEPEYAFIPGIGKNHHGGVCSAPVFGRIAQRSLSYLGIPPDDPFGYPKGDPRRDATKADWLNEAQKLQEKYQSWNNKNASTDPKAKR